MGKLSAASGFAGLAVSAVLVLGLSACGPGGSPAGAPAASGVGSAPSATSPGAASNTSPAPTPSAAAPASSDQPKGVNPLTSLAPGAQWLYELSSESTRPAGRASGPLLGDAGQTEFANSTSQYIGCEGVADETSYQLGGAFTLLNAQVGLRPGTPEGIKVVVDVYLDDTPVTRLQIDRDGGAPLQVVLTGGGTLKFVVAKLTGQCQNADSGYLVFGNAQVS